MKKRRYVEEEKGGWIDNIEVENKNTLFCDECVEDMKEYVAKCYKNK